MKELVDKYIFLSREMTDLKEQMDSLKGCILEKIKERIGTDKGSVSLPGNDGSIRVSYSQTAKWDSAKLREAFPTLKEDFLDVKVSVKAKNVEKLDQETKDRLSDCCSMVTQTRFTILS